MEKRQGSNPVDCSIDDYYYNDDDDDDLVPKGDGASVHVHTLPYPPFRAY